MGIHQVTVRAVWCAGGCVFPDITVSCECGWVRTVCDPDFEQDGILPMAELSMIIGDHLEAAGNDAPPRYDAPVTEGGTSDAMD